MDKRNLSNLGDEIKDIVQNAVNTRDFHQLNRDIGNTVNSALDEVKRAISSNPRDGRQGYNQGYNQGYRQFNQQPPRNNQQNMNTQMKSRHTPPAIVSNHYVPVGRVSGTILTVFGSIGTSLLGIAVVVLSIIGSVSGELRIFGSIVLGLLPLLIGSVFMSMKGGKIRKRIKRFRQYVGSLHGRNYFMIKEISSNVGLSPKYVIKDLRKMISDGMFPEGHLDEQQTCFMLNHESYEQYLNSQEAMRVRNSEEQKQQMSQEKQVNKENTEKNTQPTVSDETRKSIQEGRLYIHHIKEANEAIPGEEISRKLDRLESVTSKIFDYVEVHPDQLSDIQKFMAYYLPTTLKLLNAYKEFDNQMVQGENISSAKQEIEITLDTINQAFENLLDSLFEDVAMDISTDISVLETMLAQEGLTEKDFNKNRKMGG